MNKTFQLEWRKDGRTVFEEAETLTDLVRIVMSSYVGAGNGVNFSVARETPPYDNGKYPLMEFIFTPPTGWQLGRKRDDGTAKILFEETVEHVEMLLRFIARTYESKDRFSIHDPKYIRYPTHFFGGSTWDESCNADYEPAPGFAYDHYNYYPGGDEYWSVLRDGADLTIWEQLQAGLKFSPEVIWRCTEHESHIQLLAEVEKRDALELDDPQYSIGYFLAGIHVQKFEFENDQIAEQFLRLAFLKGVKSSQIMEEWVTEIGIDEDDEEANRWLRSERRKFNKRKLAEKLTAELPAKGKTKSKTKL